MSDSWRRRAAPSRSSAPYPGTAPPGCGSGLRSPDQSTSQRSPPRPDPPRRPQAALKSHGRFILSSCGSRYASRGHSTRVTGAGQPLRRGRREEARGAADVSVRFRATGRTSTGTVPVEGHRNQWQAVIRDERRPVGTTRRKRNSRNQMSSGPRVATQTRGPTCSLDAAEAPLLTAPAAGTSPVSRQLRPPR